MSLVRYCQADKDKQNRIIKQCKSAEETLDYLEHICEQVLLENIFSETDGYIRGIKDGEAQCANKLLETIKGLRQ